MKLISVSSYPNKSVNILFRAKNLQICLIFQWGISANLNTVSEYVQIRNY